MSHDDYAVEPVPGLPENLPQGENILWQGRPEWVSLALRVYHLREIALYFGVIMLWRAFSVWWETGDAGMALFGFLSLVLPAAASILILGAMAYLAARMSVYTVTDKRVVMRIGIALPTTFNLPYAGVTAARVNLFGNGTDKGDITLALVAPNKIAYLVLWPHARPWRFRNPEPALRCLADCARVADILAKALRAASITAPASIPAAETRPAENDKLTQVTRNPPVSDMMGLTAAGQ